jgi:hypothetical protein
VTLAKWDEAMNPDAGALISDLDSISSLARMHAAAASRDELGLKLLLPSLYLRVCLRTSTSDILSIDIPTEDRTAFVLAYTKFITAFNIQAAEVDVQSEPCNHRDCSQVVKRFFPSELDYGNKSNLMRATVFVTQQALRQNVEIWCNSEHLVCCERGYATLLAKNAELRELTWNELPSIFGVFHEWDQLQEVWRNGESISIVDALLP